MKKSHQLLSEAGESLDYLRDKVRNLGTPTHIIGDTFCKYPLQEKREFDSQSVFCHVSFDT